MKTSDAPATCTRISYPIDKEEKQLLIHLANVSLERRINERRQNIYQKLFLTIKDDYRVDN